MAKYAWSDFSKEDDFNELLLFFRELMPLLNEGEKASFCVVFVSRKAYCLFLLLKEKGCIKDDGYTVYSDRYIMKNLDEQSFLYKEVKLVDDTITTGMHFAEIYQMLEKRIKDVKIIPYIFMEDENFQENKQRLPLYCRKNFAISGRIKRESNKILRFCTIETLVMHLESIPYMIEIPNIQEKFDNDEKSAGYYISVTETELQQLKKGNDVWKYYSCKQAGFEQNEVGNDVIIRKNHILSSRFPTFIFNFVIRVQVTKYENMYRLVFLPFAVLKSVKLPELVSFFFLIFGNTEYGYMMQKYIKQYPDSWQEDIYVAVYRAVVFYLSAYIGEEYIDYLHSVLGRGRQFQFNSVNYCHNFTESFIKSMEELQYTHLEVTTRILGFGGFTEVPLRDNGLLKHSNLYSGIKCDYRTVSLLFAALINEVRDDSMKNEDSLLSQTEWMRFSPIEEYQELMLVIFPMIEKEKLNDIFSMCIVNMLSQSKVSNEICFDKDKKEGIVYRGFKYGENSEAYLELSAKVFFTAVMTFYDTCPPENRYDSYRMNYRVMLLHLKLFLIEYQLYESVITRDEFKIYSEIFRAKSEASLETTVNGKRFLLDDPQNPHYIEKLKDFIRKANI